MKRDMYCTNSLTRTIKHDDIKTFQTRPSTIKILLKSTVVCLRLLKELKSVSAGKLFHVLLHFLCRACSSTWNSLPADTDFNSLSSLKHTSTGTTTVINIQSILMSSGNLCSAAEVYLFELLVGPKCR